MKPISFEIPLPPTVNHYYIKTGRRYILSPKYNKFLIDTKILWLKAGCPKVPGKNPVALLLECHAPNMRRYDVDNRLKATQDVFTKIGLWQDDSQVIISCGFKDCPIQKGKAIIRIVDFTQEMLKELIRLWS